jgi:superfamily II DNA or RNA helicase
MIDEGFSSDVKVYIHNGNTRVKYKGDYHKEHEFGIIKSGERNNKITKLTSKRSRQSRLPLMVFCKHHRHLDFVYKRLMKKAGIVGHELFGLRIEKVHHQTPNRKEIVERFRDGKTDILVGSYILKRGMNFPLLRWIINAGGGDSVENVLQILGRATRKHESKKYTGMDDFYDRGQYLRRHSYHRVNTYKKEKLKVIEKYDKKLL